LALVAREDALEWHAHSARQSHALEHVARTHAAVHHIEVLDVDAVDALMKVTVLVTIQAPRQLAHGPRHPPDPEVARLAGVSVGGGKLGDGHLGDPPGGRALARPGARCQSSDLIGCPPARRRAPFDPETPVV